MRNSREHPLIDDTDVSGQCGDEGWPPNYVALNRAAYDSLAPEYRARLASDAKRDPALLRPFVKLLEGGLEGATIRVLDVGCGAGLNLAMFAAEGFDVTGIDVSLEMLGVARDTCPEAHLVQDDYLTHEFAPQTFDGVFAKAIIHLFTKADAASVLSKSYHLLAPGGAFYVTTTIHDKCGSGFWQKQDYQVSAARYRRAWTPEELTEAVIAAGFDVAQTGTNSEIERGKLWFSIWARRPADAGGDL